MKHLLVLRVSGAENSMFVFKAHFLGFNYQCSYLVFQIHGTHSVILWLPCHW